MATTLMRVLALVAAMACVVAARPVQQDSDDFAECGVQADGAECFYTLCCSKDGKCGVGDEYCGGGCQSGPCGWPQVKSTTTTTAECGKQAHFADCWPRTQCCSVDGMCGTGNAFCGTGCQSGDCDRNLNSV